eukprot:scaffold20874_cov48-Cyclotella_meneghiniana.AAC.1
MESTGEVESTAPPSYMTSSPMPNPSLGNTNAGDDQTKSIKLQETAMMLNNLSLEQLLQVQHYIASLESSDGSAPSGVESSVHMNMNGTMGNIQTQQNISERDSMGFNQTTVQQFQHTPEVSQMQSLGPSSNIQSNLNGKSTMSNGSTMHSNKQQMGFNMQSSMNGAQNSGHNPTIANEGAMNINSHHQFQQPLPNGMGQMHGVTPDPTVVSAPTLPPVEKEGNPFDMY